MCTEDRAYKRRPGLPCTWLKYLIIFMFYEEICFKTDFPITLTKQSVHIAIMPYYFHVL